MQQKESLWHVPETPQNDLHEDTVDLSKFTVLKKISARIDFRSKPNALPVAISILGRSEVNRDC